MVNKRFRVCSYDQPFLLPRSLQDWLPENHLARFIAEVMNELDLSSIYASYERSDGRGLAAYHPTLMARLLLYGYCIGITSSRKIEQATYDNVAFRYLSADQHPDHDTIAAFRQRHHQALADLFVQALRLCQKAGLVKLGNVSIDGTKIKANANGYFPYTPALPMLHGLREALAILEEEGLENVFARHHRLGKGARAAVNVELNVKSGPKNVFAKEIVLPRFLNRPLEDCRAFREFTANVDVRGVRIEGIT